MDFVEGLDPSKLVLAGTALSFVISPFVSPPYNLPLFLFGAYAQENAEATQSLQLFTGLLTGSLIYDIVYMSINEQAGFIKFVTVLLLLLKIPTLFAFVLAIRQRGGQFSGLGARGPDLGGATVWSMPGGFTTSMGRDGYQSVDEPVERPVPATKPSVPAALPSHPQQPAAAPGAYQTV